MKRLILIASVSVAAFVAVPLASANAAAVGECTIEGKATFTPNLKTFPNGFPPGVEATAFAFIAAKGHCTGTESLEFVSATNVKGSGVLSCPVAGAGLEVGPTGAHGTGELTVKENGVTQPARHFALKLVAAAGVVPLVITGEIMATGFATFLTDPESVKSCAVNGEAESLNFVAVTAGTV
jgi:hypothetical protein